MKISTTLQAKHAKPGVHKVSGAPGLYLKVGESGSGSYFWRFRLGDKRREIGLGSRERVTLAEAREAVKDQDALRRKGVDPIEQRRRERAANVAKSRAEQPIAFREAAEAYLRAHGPSWKHRYARATWLNPIKAYAYPIIGDLALEAIELSHVVAVMEAAEEAGAKETARRVRARIERVLTAAMAKGRCDSARRNPADAKLIAATRPTRRSPGTRPHYRAVKVDGAPEVFRALACQDGSAFSSWVFMIATAARPSEALGARWQEVDFDRRLWTLPAARMKSAREHVVPLSTAALAVLKRQACVRTGDAIFPGRSGAPLSYNSFAAAPAKAGIDAACPHGWRSVFRDWAGDIGEISPDLAEAALAHSLGATEGAYRRLTAVDRRRAVMEAYARWLNDHNAKVVAFLTSKTA